MSSKKHCFIHKDEPKIGTFASTLLDKYLTFFRKLLTLGLDRIVQFDTISREPIDEFGLYDGQKVSCLNYSQSGKLLAFATSEGQIYCRTFPEDEAERKAAPIQGCTKRPIDFLAFNHEESLLGM